MRSLAAQLVRRITDSSQKTAKWTALLFDSFWEIGISTVCSVCRLLIKNGNNIDSSTLYDSYEVEYLPNEGIVSSSRYLFIEFTTDGSGTNTGAAIRYEGMDMASFLDKKCSTGLQFMVSPLLPACSRLTRQDCAQWDRAFFVTFETLEAIITPRRRSLLIAIWGFISARLHSHEGLWHFILMNLKTWLCRTSYLDLSSFPIIFLFRLGAVK